jgi:hypothetical protein
MARRILQFAARTRQNPRLRGHNSTGLHRFHKAYVYAYFPVVLPYPATHAFQRIDECASQFGQRVFDTHYLRIDFPPADQTCRFEIAEGFREHSLGNTFKAPS